MEEFVHVAVGVEQVVVALSRSGVGVVFALLPDVFAHAQWELDEFGGIEGGGRIRCEPVADEADAVEDGAGTAPRGDDVEALSSLVVDPGGLRAVGAPADGPVLLLALALPLFEALGDAGAAVFEFGESDERGGGRAGPGSGAGSGEPPLSLRDIPASSAGQASRVGGGGAECQVAAASASGAVGLAVVKV